MEATTVRRTADGEGAVEQRGVMPPVAPAIGDPAPLGLAGFALTTFVLSFFNAGLVSDKGVPVVLGLALAYGGIAQLLAGMWEFRNNNTFGATAFSSFGAFWISFFVLEQFEGSKIPAANLGDAVGLYLIAWGIFTTYMLIPSFRVSVAVMQSNGGTFGPAEARARPVVLAQSGPVAGVSAARALAEAADLGDVITADMGGTSFDVAVIHRGEPERRVRAEVFGLATAMPMVAVSSVGAGGGSIAWQDARGMLRVGPRSAGADPGPACYGRGGQEPAVTDALVALGLLDPGNFLGGRLVLDGESAVAALGRLGRAVGLDVEGTARGVYRLSHEQMTLAVKGLLVERGLDPRRFTLLCYGGCGPLFGAPIARALAIGRVVVPGLSAVFSAYGAATADVRREAVRTLFRPLPVELGALATACAALEAEVMQAMLTEGVDAAHVTLVHEVDLRFHRQTWEVTVPLGSRDRPTVEGLGDAFRARYAELYGRGALAAGAGIDLVNCRVIGIGRIAPRATASAGLGPPDPTLARRGARVAWLPGAAGRAPVPVYDGERLLAGMAIVGPALVERRDTTILVPSGDRAAVDGLGSVVIEAGHA